SVGRGLSRERSFRGHPHELSRCPGSPLAPSELLVSWSRGAVLHRLPDALPPDRLVGRKKQDFVQSATDGGPRGGDRRLLRLLDSGDVREFAGGVLLAADQILGTGAGRPHCPARA